MENIVLKKIKINTLEGSTEYDLPSGGGADLNLSIVDGKLCMTYDEEDDNNDNGN